MLCESVKMCDEFFIARKVTVELLQMLTFQTSCKHTSVYIVSSATRESITFFYFLKLCGQQVYSSLQE